MMQEHQDDRYEVGCYDDASFFAKPACSAGTEPLPHHYRRHMAGKLSWTSLGLPESTAHRRQALA